jgi:predicted RNA methylase
MPVSRSESILTEITVLPLIQQAEAFETLRRQLPKIAEPDHCFTALCEHYLKNVEELPLATEKALLRVLQQYDQSHPALESRLLDTLEQKPNLLAYRIATLGACGNQASMTRLESLVLPENASPFLLKSLELARSRLRRKLAPQVTPGWENPILPLPLHLRLSCVPGMENALAKALAEAWPELQIPDQHQPLSGEIPASLHKGKWDHEKLQRCRLHLDCAFDGGKWTSPGSPTDNRTLISSLCHWVSSSPLPQIAASVSPGCIRFAVRVEGMASAQKSFTASLAKQLEEQLNRCPNEPTGAGRWINEPRTEDWVFHFEHQASQWKLRLTPDKTHFDGRFDYRIAYLPAASRPTVAALLARLAGKLPHAAKVLDPFCGSGLELIETVLLHKKAQLHGGDLDPTALEACKSNASSAQVSDMRLLACDALQWDIKGFDLIITNPPFGRRAKVDDIGKLLDATAKKAASWLKSGGRLVWVSPQPRRSRAQLQTLGFELIEAHLIDLGGMRVEAQAWQKNAQSTPKPGPSLNEPKSQTWDKGKTGKPRSKGPNQPPWQT